MTDKTPGGTGSNRGMVKFLLRLSPFVTVCFLIIVVPLVAVDPYNIFHWRHVRDNGVEPNKNYIKLRYILSERPPFNAYLFGSSRVAFIAVERIDDFDCYNMTYSEGVPAEHLQNLMMMTRNGIVPRMVLIGVDEISCFVDPARHKTDLMRMPPPSTVFGYIPFFLKYYDPTLLIPLVTFLPAKSKAGQTDPYFYTTGTFPRDAHIFPNFDWSTARPNWPDYYKNRIPETLEDIQKIKQLCEDKNINCIIFTNPTHILTYKKSVEEGYLDFLYGLAGITDYYNFSGVNDITCNNANYFETSHFKWKIGDMIIDRIFNNVTDEKLLAQGFGWYVTKDNRDSFLALLKSQIQQ